MNTLSEYTSGNIKELSINDIYSSNFLEAEHRTKNSKNSQFVKLCEGMFLALLLSASVEMQPLPSFKLERQMNQTEFFTSRQYVQSVDVDLLNAKVTLSPKFSSSKEYLKQLQKEGQSFRKIERELALRRNFMLNMPQAFPKEYMVGLNHYTSLLSRLNFQNDIVQYNIEDEMFEFSLYFKNDIKLSLSLMADESEDLADFSVFQHHELLVADVMPVKSLVTKMEKLLKKIDEQVKGLS